MPNETPFTLTDRMWIMFAARKDMVCSHFSYIIKR